MAKAIIMCGGSGGAASDECTALKGHVLAGKTAVTQDSGDEPAAGTMPERGNWNGSVGMNGSIIIPEGHHSGAGKVTGPSVTQRGAWTSRLGINGKIAIPEGYHNGFGYVDQAIVTQGALTLNPGTTAKTGAVSGKYMTGNITVPAVSIPANLIKKGAQITFPDGSKSPVGTWEGYVAGASDLFYNGIAKNMEMRSGKWEGQYIIADPFATSQNYWIVNFLNANCLGKTYLEVHFQIISGGAPDYYMKWGISKAAGTGIESEVQVSVNYTNWVTARIPLNTLAGNSNVAKLGIFCSTSWTPLVDYRIDRISLV